MMTPTIEDHRHLRAAQGYASLGMYLEANSELTEMSRPCRGLREVLEVKHEIFRSLGNWDLVEVIAAQLSEVADEKPRQSEVETWMPARAASPSPSQEVGTAVLPKTPLSTAFAPYGQPPVRGITLAPLGGTSSAVL